jgi:hypothetical protein
MEPIFNPRCFKVSSTNSEVDYIIVERDGIGWKMDVIGHDHNEWPHGDTYQDTLDELLPFLAHYADENSIWADYGSGEKLSFWAAVTSVTGRLD